MMNKLCHFEIGCRDYPRTKEFYSQLFDWRFERKDDGREVIRTGDDVGGHLNSLGHEPYHYVTFYIMVDDVASSLKKAEELGGKKIVGPVQLPDAGTFGWLADPEGNVIGVYTEKK